MIQWKRRMRKMRQGLNMKLDRSYVEQYLTEQEYEAYVEEHQEELRVLDENAYASDMLGWLHPGDWADEEMCGRIEDIAAEVRERAEVFVVIGLGGSNQGARAVIEALSPQDVRPEGPEILYAALNLSASYYEAMIKHIGSRSVYLNVIAKNFKTLEPGLVFRMFRHYMESRYSKEEAARRIITTPTVNDGLLHRISLENGYRYLPFPDNVGGRYSVFTPVGLLPIAVAGIDIRKFLKGARKGEQAYLSGGEFRENAKCYAVTRNALMDKGYGIEVLAFFEPQLEAFGRWWRQLFAESEGKNHTALFPVVCSFTEDLHSVGQYLQQGKRQMIETFIHINTPPCDKKVDDEVQIEDGFGYLEGMSFHEINECAYQATVKAHSEGGVPCMIVELEKMDAQNIGELLYFYFIVCFYSSVLLGVDPFDQPGVENYKTEMFRLLKQDEPIDVVLPAAAGIK